MDEIDPNERLRAVVARFCVPKVRGLLDMAGPPFDTGKPNLHDTKAEFIEEKRAVEDALGNAEALLEFLMAGYRPEDAAHEVAERVLGFVDDATSQRARFDVVESAVGMIRKNAADVGVSYSLIFLLIDFVQDLTKRKQELENQEAAYWRLLGRAPNYYARTIALRFARLIARETGKKPTFGTSRDGGHPSTDFGRALEEIFEILGIEAKVRHPAIWAINQLTEEDLKPEPVNALAGFRKGSLFGMPPPQNALAAIANALAKGGDS